MDLTNVVEKLQKEIEQLTKSIKVLRNNIEEITFTCDRCYRLSPNEPFICDYCHENICQICKPLGRYSIDQYYCKRCRAKLDENDIA